MTFLGFHLVPRDDFCIFEDFRVPWTRFRCVDAPATLCPQTSNICWKRPKNGHFLVHRVPHWHLAPKSISTKIFQKMLQDAKKVHKSPIYIIIHTLNGPEWKLENWHFWHFFKNKIPLAKTHKILLQKTPLKIGIKLAHIRLNFQRIITFDLLRRFWWDQNMLETWCWSLWTRAGTPSICT